MAETNHLIARGDVAALVPEDVSSEVWELAIQQSFALSALPRIQMASNQQRIPVLSALPTAYWVDGDTGLKQTTAQAWSNKYIDIAELAVIVPIPEAVLDDTTFDIWAEVQPRLVEAIGHKVDEALLLGMDKPAILPDGLKQKAIEAGNHVTRGSVNEGGQEVAGDGNGDGDLADDFNYLMSLVEEDGYEVAQFLLDPRYQSRFRGLRDANGQLIYVPGVPNVSPSTVYGVPAEFGLRGRWQLQEGAGQVEGFAGDTSSIVVGIRQDINYKLLEEATIHNPDGTPAFNLAQQDMVALRATFRVGWQYRDLPTPEKPEWDDNQRFPWAVITDSDPA